MSKRNVIVTMNNSAGVLDKRRLVVDVPRDGWFATTEVGDAMIEMIRECGRHLMPGDSFTVTEGGA
jgi:hypothetical protein